MGKAPIRAGEIVVFHVEVSLKPMLSLYVWVLLETSTVLFSIEATCDFLWFPLFSEFCAGYFFRVKKSLKICNDEIFSLLQQHYCLPGVVSVTICSLVAEPNLMIVLHMLALYNCRDGIYLLCIE